MDRFYTERYLTCYKNSTNKCSKDEPKAFKAFHNRALQELQISKLPGDCSKKCPADNFGQELMGSFIYDEQKY